MQAGAGATGTPCVGDTQACSQMTQTLLSSENRPGCPQHRVFLCWGHPGLFSDDTDIAVNVNTCAETLPWTKTQADHFMSFNLDSTHLSRQGLLLSIFRTRKPRLRDREGLGRGCRGRAGCRVPTVIHHALSCCCPDGQEHTRYGHSLPAKSAGRAL